MNAAKKRIFSLFLVIVMMLGLLPTNALASNETETETQIIDSSVSISQSTDEGPAIDENKDTTDLGDTQAPADEQNTDDTQAPADEQSTDDAQAPADEQNTDDAQAPADEQNTDDAQIPTDGQQTDGQQTDDERAHAFPAPFGGNLPAPAPPPAQPVNVLERINGIYQYLYEDKAPTLLFFNGTDDSGAPKLLGDGDEVDPSKDFSLTCTFELVGGDNSDDQTSFRPHAGDYAQITLPTGATFAQPKTTTVYAGEHNNLEIGTLVVSGNTATLTFSQNVEGVDSGYMFTVTLDIKITITQSGGESEGERTLEILGKKIVVQKQDPNVLQSMNKQGTLDEATGEITWEINVVPNNNGLAGVVITDEVESVTVAGKMLTQKIISGSTKVYYAGDQTKKNYTDCSTSISSDEKTLTATFQNTATTQSETKTVTIEFKTKIVEYGLYNELAFTLYNQARAEKDGDFSPIKSNRAGVTGKTPRIFDKLLQTNSADKANWQLKVVPPSGFTYVGARAVDTLPSPLTLKSATYSIDGGASGTFVEDVNNEKTLGKYAYDTSTNIVTFYLGDVNQTVTIDYTTDVDEDEALKLAAQGQSITNKAILEWDKVTGGGSGGGGSGSIGGPGGTGGGSGGGAGDKEITLPVTYAKLTKTQIATVSNNGDVTLTAQVTAYNGTVDDAVVRQVFVYRADGKRACPLAANGAILADHSPEQLALREAFMQAAGLTAADMKNLPEFTYDIQPNTVDGDDFKSSISSEISFYVDMVEYKAKIVTVEFDPLAATEGSPVSKDFTIKGTIPDGALKMLLASNGIPDIEVKQSTDGQPATAESPLSATQYLKYRTKLTYGAFGENVLDGTRSFNTMFLKKNNYISQVNPDGSVDFLWSFIVNSSGFNLDEEVTITDPLDPALSPSYLEYAKVKYYFDAHSGEFTSAPSGWTITYDAAKHNVVIKIANVTRRIDFNLVTTMSDALKLSGNSLETIRKNNTAYIEAESIIPSRASVSKAVTPARLLEKTGENWNGKIKWTIKLNQGGYDLSNLVAQGVTTVTLVDMLGPNQRVESVTLNDAPYTNYTVDSDTPSKNGGMDLTFAGLDPTKAYTFVIVTAVTDPSASNVINQAKLTGLKQDLDSGNKTTQTVSSNGVGNVTRGGTIQLYKHKSGDASSVLTDAEFAVYDASGNTKLTTLIYNTSTGAYEASGLAKTKYVIKELTAPAGYQNSQNVAVTSANGASTDIYYDAGVGGWVVNFNKSYGLNVDIYDDLLTQDLVLEKQLSFTKNGNVERLGEQMTFVFELTYEDADYIKDMVFNIDGTSDTVSFDANGKTTLHVNSGSAVKIKALPIGEYTVKETGIWSNGGPVTLDISPYTRITTHKATDTPDGAGESLVYEHAHAAQSSDPSEIIFHNLYARSTGGGGGNPDPKPKPGITPPPVVDLPDIDPPLAPPPIIDDPDELIDIPDEKPPLAKVPQTGDSASLWLKMLGASGLAALLLNARTKKRKDDAQ